MQFNQAAFNDHIANMGQSMLWRRAAVCPCVSPQSRQPKPSCPHCRGKGQLWAAKGTRVVAGVASQKTQQQWAKFGLWAEGDSVVVLPENSPIYDIGKFDRVVMLNSTDPFSIVLTRNALDERIMNPVASVSRVFWISPQGGIVEGGIPSISDDGVPTWAAGVAAPPERAQYSITGTEFVEYFHYLNYPSDRNQHQGMRLPRRVVLRRFSLFDK